MFTSNPFDAEHVGRQMTLRQAHPYIAAKHVTVRFCRKVWQLFEKGNPFTNRISAIITAGLLVGTFVEFYVLNANPVVVLAAAAGWVCLGFAAFVNALPPIDGYDKKS